MSAHRDNLVFLSFIFSVPSRAFSEESQGCFSYNGGYIFYLLKTGFGPNITPRASFGMNMGGIDAEDHKESETRTPTYRKPKKQQQMD